MIARNFVRWGLACAWALPCVGWALEVRFERVTEGVYVHVGDTGHRTVDNEALNANIGLVVTPGGAVLVDSGATAQSARKIDEAVKRVTDQPVRWVINTGGQDHRWLGNGYFRQRGAQLIAHAAAVADMRSRGGDQLAALQALLGAAAAGTVPTLPDRIVEGTDASIELGGVRFELRHRGGGHTPGDMMVWLPSRRVLFAGDIVYIDRALAVLPVSSTKAWLAAFGVIEALAPQHIVPGHGRVTDLATARSQTKNLLLTLRTHMKRAVDDGKEVGEAARSFDARSFMHLRLAADAMPGNANRTYLEVERE